MSREQTSRGRRPFKVWDSSRGSRKALVVSSLEELIVRGREKLGVGSHESVKAVLETDGTQVDDTEYFGSLPDNTVFLLLRPGERWCPAGIDVIRAALSSIPRIVCEAISSLDLQNEVPSWKIMESRGKITIVLTWDHRPLSQGANFTASSTSPEPVRHHAPPLSTTHKFDAFARRIISSPHSPSPSSFQEGSISPGAPTSSRVPSRELGPSSLGRMPYISGLGGARTYVTRDGKLETVINGGGLGVSRGGGGGVPPSITVISHEEPPYDSVPFTTTTTGAGRVGGLGGGSAIRPVPSSVPPPLPPHQYHPTSATAAGHPYQYTLRGLPRQGSSSLESTTATQPIHTHTIECAQRGHLPQHPPHGTGGRATSPPEPAYCDFHCCALHEEGRKIQVHKTVATSPIDPGMDRHLPGGRVSPLPGTSAAAQAAATKLHVRFMGVAEDKNGRSMYVSKKIVPSSLLSVPMSTHSQQQQPPVPPHHHPLPSMMPSSSRVSSVGTGTNNLMSYRRSTSSYVDPGGGVGGMEGETTTTESSESETEGNSTLMEDEGVTTQKFLLLTDQLSLDQKRHLTIKEIGIILERLSSKIIDVERLDRESEARDCFHWTIKATIRGDALRELGVIYNGNYYAISEHPQYSSTQQQQQLGSTSSIKTRDEFEDIEEDMRL